MASLERFVSVLLILAVFAFVCLQIYKDYQKNKKQ